MLCRFLSEAFSFNFRCNLRTKSKCISRKSGLMPGLKDNSWFNQWTLNLIRTFYYNKKVMIEMRPVFQDVKSLNELWSCIILAFSVVFLLLWVCWNISNRVEARWNVTQQMKMDSNLPKYFSVKYVKSDQNWSKSITIWQLIHCHLYL